MKNTKTLDKELNSKEIYNRIQKTAAKNGDREVVVYIEHIKCLRNATNHAAGKRVAV